MRNYAQIQCAFWVHPKIKELSHNAKLLAAYLISGPHSNGLGCYRLPLQYINSDLNWRTSTATKAMRELSEIDFCDYCESTQIVFMPNFMRWNSFKNKNVATARQKEFNQLPSNLRFMERLACSCLEFGEHWSKQFENHLQTVSNTDQYQPLTEQNQPTAYDQQTDSKPSRFCDFWNVYPKKVDQKKSEQLWKTKSLDSHAQMIIDDVVNRKAKDHRWLNQYVPSPKNYLENENWHDEIVSKPLQNVEPVKVREYL